MAVDVRREKFNSVKLWALVRYARYAPRRRIAATDADTFKVNLCACGSSTDPWFKSIAHRSTWACNCLFAPNETIWNYLNRFWKRSLKITILNSLAAKCSRGLWHSLPELSLGGVEGHMCRMLTRSLMAPRFIRRVPFVYTLVTV